MLEEVLNKNQNVLTEQKMTGHKFSLVADKVSNNEGGVSYSVLNRTKLSNLLIDMGFSDQEYMHFLISKTGLVDGALMISAEIHRNIFSDEGMLFSALLEQFLGGHFTESHVPYISSDKKEHVLLDYDRPVIGETVTITFPEHYAVDSDGKKLINTFLIGGEYVRKEVIKSEVSFFFFPNEKRINVIDRYLRTVVELNRI